MSVIILITAACLVGLAVLVGPLTMCVVRNLFSR